MTDRLKIDRSNEYWERARKLIPAGTQTFSKGPTQYVDGVAPKYLARGDGCHVWDVDGNEFIDHVLGLGALTLGYHNPKVDEAVTRQLRDGPTFSLMHPLEVEVSEKLVELIPCAEMVRFGKNGSDVTSGAVRAARAYTGREKIACCGYHGWQDWYIGTTTRAKGVPESTKELTLPFRYNDLQSLEELFAANPGEIAAVIMEAIAIEEPAAGFLADVKELAHRNGALLIFDEVVNGFRLAIAGAQEYYGVVPDMATFGKGMANGMPLAAVVGSAEVMKEFGEVFFSFTFGGEALSLAAAMATIAVFETESVIEHIAKQGRKLLNGYNRLAAEHGLAEITQAKGVPAHSVMYFNAVGAADPLLLKSLFQQEALKRGILTLALHNMCLAMSDADIEVTLNAYNEALAVLKKAVDDDSVAARLEGEPIRPIFTRW